VDVKVHSQTLKSSAGAGGFFYGIKDTEVL